MKTIRTVIVAAILGLTANWFWPTRAQQMSPPPTEFEKHMLELQVTQTWEQFLLSYEKYEQLYGEEQTLEFYNAINAITMAATQYAERTQ